MTAPALSPGSTLETWCSACHQKTPHIYKPGTKCPLECEKCKGEVKK